MTEDTIPLTYATHSTLCEPCAGVQQNWRRAKGHPELIQGTHRAVAHRHGAVTITKYVCERCGTVGDMKTTRSTGMRGGR